MLIGLGQLGPPPTLAEGGGRQKGVNPTHEHCVRKQEEGILPERKAIIYTTGGPSQSGKIQAHSLKEGSNVVSDIWEMNRCL